MHSHNVVIDKIAPEGSSCEMCGKPAKWQMYCMECGHILRFYCDEHAFLSQGDEKLEKQVKKTFIKKIQPKKEKDIVKAKAEWQAYLTNVVTK